MISPQKFFITFCLLMLIGIPIGVFAQIQNPPAPIDGNQEPKISTDYLIGKGDLLDIKVINQEKLSGKYRVSDSGTINAPFIGQIQVLGLTEAALTEIVREKLLKILRQPELVVSVVEYNSQNITVIGAVKTPGRYPIRQPLRLLDILGLAGGATDRTGTVINLVRYPPVNPNTPTTPVKEEDVKVFSVNLNDLLQGNLELNLLVQSGDIINVPEADVIYVTGNVNKPGAFNTKAPVTLTQALALAGGITATAQRKQISIFRAKAGSADRSEIIVDIGQIEKRKEKDPLLMPNDVVYIRDSQAKAIGLAFLRAVTGGLGSSVGVSVIR